MGVAQAVPFISDDRSEVGQVYARARVITVHLNMHGDKFVSNEFTCNLPRAVTRERARIFRTPRPID